MFNIILKKTFIIPTLVIAVLYVVITIYMMNIRLVLSTIFGSFDLDYKFKLLTALLEGLWTSMSSSGIIMLFTIAVLTGANLTLIFQRIVRMHSFGKLGLFSSFGSLLGLVSGGCAACSLPVLGLLGLGTSVAYLPFRGTELSVLSIVLLLISCFIMIRSEMQSKVCKVK